MKLQEIVHPKQLVRQLKKLPKEKIKGKRYQSLIAKMRAKNTGE